jgi:hypothetical protein
MEKQKYLIRFDDVSAADANRYAEELRQDLLDIPHDSSDLARTCSCDPNDLDCEVRYNAAR